MRYQPRYRKNRKRRKRRGLRLLRCIIVFAVFFAAIMLTKELVQASVEQAAFMKLSAIAAEPTEQETPTEQRALIQTVSPKPIAVGIAIPAATPSPTPAPTPTPEPIPLPQYVPLYEQNPDFFGWITIEGTNIDYPVMYSPNRPEYYLKRAFDGSDSASGALFIDGNCPADGNYYLIYGHHMKNKTMFGQIPNYAEQSYYEEHPIIRFDTLFEQREYQVIAAFYSRLYWQYETDVFRYYQYTDLTDEAVFEEYIEQVQVAAIYDTGLTAEYGDELLTLTTCNYHTQDGRFVVVARRIAPP